MSAPYILSKGSKEVYNSGLHHDWIIIIDVMLMDSPIDFTLVSGKRSTGQQHDLFKIGRWYDYRLGPMSNPKAWLETGAGTATNCEGYIIESEHQSGMALDFQAFVPDQPLLSYDHVHVGILVGAFMATASFLYREEVIFHVLRSGGDWDRDTHFLEPKTLIDLCHLELIKP